MNADAHTGNFDFVLSVYYLILTKSNSYGNLYIVVSFRSMLYKVWPLSESECRAKTALVGGRLADKRSHWYDTQRCDLASRSVITRSVGEFTASSTVKYWIWRQKFPGVQFRQSVTASREETGANLRALLSGIHAARLLIATCIYITPTNDVHLL